MTRQIICYEGKHPVNGKFISKGALTWDEEKPLPVVLKPSDNGPLVGLATDLKREDDGAITAEMKFNARNNSVLEDLPSGLGWTIYASDIKWSDMVETILVSGVIREVFLAPSLPWSR